MARPPKTNTSDRPQMDKNLKQGTSEVKVPSQSTLEALTEIESGEVASFDSVEDLMTYLDADD